MTFLSAELLISDANVPMAFNVDRAYFASPGRAARNDWVRIVILPPKTGEVPKIMPS